MEKAKGEGLYQPDSGPFDFAAAFSVPQGEEEGDQADRRDKGKQLMEKLTAKSNYYDMLHTTIHDEMCCILFHLTKFLKCDKYQRPFYQKTGGGGCLMSELHVPQSV